MANATIVQLGSSFDSTATTFEQEFSEARGRGRARRQARRQDRIKKRDERRSTRQAARQGRKATRQKRRADMRDTRRQRRQDSKMRRTEARQERKMRRTEGRQARRDVKAQRELDRDAAAMEQQAMMDERYGEDMPMDEPVMQDAAYAEEGGYDDGGYDAGGYDDGGYADEGGYDEEGGYADEGGYDEEGGYADEGGYDEEGYEFDGDGFSFADGDDDDDDSDFDGDSYEFFDDNEGETPFDFADGSGTQTPPVVQDVANRIEWNKELCCRLRDKAAAGQIPQDVAQAEINKSVGRISELQSCMDMWCNMEGDFVSDASGTTKFVATAKPTAKGRLANKFKRKQRIASLKAALQKAKNARKRSAVKPKLSMGKRRKLASLPPAQRQRLMQAWGVAPKAAPMAAPMAAPTMASVPTMASAPTMVSASLSPRIGGQKIIIPAQVSGADGSTGIIGLDGANDFDSRYTEVKLGADGGKSSKFPTKPILIAVGIGALIGVAYLAFKKK